MPGRNQPRSSRGRSAIARRVINTNSTNGLGINEGGGMKKAGNPPSATGFMRSKPWQMSFAKYTKNTSYQRKQLKFSIIKKDDVTTPPVTTPPVTTPPVTTPPVTTQSPITGEPENFNNFYSQFKNLNITWPSPPPLSCPSPVQQLVGSMQSYFDRVNTAFKTTGESDASYIETVNIAAHQGYCAVCADASGGFNDPSAVQLLKEKYQVSLDMFKYDKTGLISNTPYDTFLNTAQKIYTDCTGLTPGKSNEPTPEQWEEVVTELKKIYKKFYPPPHSWGNMTNCDASENTYKDSTPTYIWDVKSFIENNKKTSGSIDNVNLGIRKSYDYNLISQYQKQWKTSPPGPPPKPFVFSFKNGDNSITATPSIKDFDTYIWGEPSGYFAVCSQTQDYTKSLEIQEQCFKNTITDLSNLIAEIKNPSDVESCISKNITISCIKDGSGSVDASWAQTWATSLKNYITDIENEFYTLYDKLKHPIDLSNASNLICTFNTYSKNIFKKSYNKLSTDIQLNAVQLSTPTSMTTPISGCLWGNLQTSMGKITDKFNDALRECTQSKRCSDISIEPSGNCVVPIDPSWQSYDDIFNFTCKLTNSTPSGEVVSVCNLNTYLRYMTGGKVWNGSIKGSKKLLVDFFTQSCSGEDISANKTFRKLIGDSYIPTSQVNVPNVVSDISDVWKGQTNASIDDVYAGYSAYFNNMRVWLTFYYGPQVGKYLVKSLETNYLDWYNHYHSIRNLNARDVSWSNITDLMWSPEELTGGAAPDSNGNTAPPDCHICKFGEISGCYIRDENNKLTTFCCIHNDGSGCYDASTKSVCDMSVNSGNSCLDGRGFTSCNVSPNEGALEQQATVLQDFLASDINTKYMASLSQLRSYQATISQGKYNLALGMEYAGSSDPSFNDYLSVLKLIPENIKGLNANLETVNGLDISLNQEVLKLLKAKQNIAEAVDDFSKNVYADISNIYSETFVNNIQHVKDFIDSSYSPVITEIKNSFPQITKCSNTGSLGDISQCGSDFSGAQSSIWQDTGSMWSQFPPPDDLISTDTSQQNPTIDSVFGKWFAKNATQGVFNYHLSFAQLDVVSDVLHGLDRAVDDTTLNDTILPYIINYKKANSSDTWADAYSGFLGGLRQTLKENTNNKGRLGLSFGGENATESDNRFLPNPSIYLHRSLNPQCDDEDLRSKYHQEFHDAAGRFYTNILKNVDSVDFDNENAGFYPQSPKASPQKDQQYLFFQSLRDYINNDTTQTPKPKLELTLLGNPATSIGLGMKNLMDNGAEFFDSVNLMLYDNGTGYYITTNNDTAWSLQNWAKAIDINTTNETSIVKTYNKLNPCYQDLTPYNDPNGDKGEQGSNWAVTAAVEISNNYGIDIKTLSVGEAAWVLNRQFLQDALTSYVNITPDKIQTFITQKASTVSWWPDNNYHGSLCPDPNDPTCNQYGVQQSFDACQILFKLGYNPYTFTPHSEEALIKLNATITKLSQQITHSNTRLQSDISNANISGVKCNLRKEKNYGNNMETYFSQLAFDVSAIGHSNNTIETIISNFNNTSNGIMAGLDISTELSPIVFSYTLPDTNITITPPISTYINEMTTLTSSAETEIAKCCPSCTPKKPGLPTHVVSGYLCTECPPRNKKTPQQLFDNLPSVYNIVVFAFMTVTCSNEACPAAKVEMTGITEYIGFGDAINTLHNNGKLAFVSWGGGGDGVFYDTYNNDTFINKVSKDIVDNHKKYKFDGLDIDLEHRKGDLHECGQAILKIIAKVKTQIPTLLIACAPQQPNLNPNISIVTAGNNEYAPIIGGDVSYNNKTIKGIDLFDLVQPQFYNIGVEGGAEYTFEYQGEYIDKLNSGYTCKSSGKSYNVRVPYNKLVMGYPAAPGAGSGYSDQTPDKLKMQNWVGGFIKDNRIRGVMTWSIGWDDQNNNTWSSAMKTIFEN